MRAYLIYRENVWNAFICRLCAFSRLIDSKYLFCRLSDFAAVSSLIIYVSTIFRFWYVCSLFIFRFRFHSLFVPRKLCVKHYASFCIFMQSKNVYLYNIMINRKLWGIFEFSLAPLRKRTIFLLFVFSLFLLFWFFRREQKQKRKNPLFLPFLP